MLLKFFAFFLFLNSGMNCVLKLTYLYFLNCRFSVIIIQIGYHHLSRILILRLISIFLIKSNFYAQFCGKNVVFCKLTVASTVAISWANLLWLSFSHYFPPQSPSSFGEVEVPSVCGDAAQRPPHFHPLLPAAVFVLLREQ